jgi:cephalosporin-C deacetylase
MNLYNPYVPEEFDEFWVAAVQEARAVHLDFHRSLRNDFDYPGFRVERIQFSSVQGRTVSGWFALPETDDKVPGFLWIPPYGRESLLPDRYGTRAGFASLSFNLHDEDAFHQEKYTPERGYFADGVGTPGTWKFRRMLQDCLIAARVMQAQIEVDEDRIAAMGMSQGAGLAIWTAAWSPIIQAVCADMPFLGAMPNSLSQSAYRYPLKELVDYMETQPLGREQVLHTLSYYDTINQATRCMKPTHVSLGLKDPACRPETVRSIYAALPWVKDLVEYDTGHDWHIAMVERNRRWLLEHM